MPFDGLAQWQIDILAADKTAQAFSSVERRIKAVDFSLKDVAGTMSAQQAVLGSLAAKQAEFNTGLAAAGRLAGPLAGVIGSLALAQRAWDAGMRSGALIDQATQLGINTDLLQSYRLLLLSGGVDAGQFDSALGRLTGLMGQANNGTAEAIATFDRLGVKLLDGAGKLRGVGDILPEVARGMMGLGSETERNALAQEVFGRQGARIVSLLPQLAEGNDAVTRAAREQGAVIDREVLGAWNKLDAQIKTTNATWDAMLATFAAPIATDMLEEFNKVLRSTKRDLERIQALWKWFTDKSGVSLDGMKSEASDVQARIDKLHAQPETNVRNAQLQREYARLAMLQQKISDGMTADYVMPAITVTPNDGKGQPVPKGTGGGASKVKDQVDELGELIQQIERMQKEGESLTDRFGDGTAYAARETARLNELLAGGYISDGTYARAIEDVTRHADDMARAYRGAAGGAEGLMAGIEQAMADMERQNSAFEMGKRLVDQMSHAITDLASGAEVDFNKILQSFLNMIIQMELRAAASNIFNAIRGKGATDQGIFGAIGDWIFGGGSAGGSAVTDSFAGGTFAEALAGGITPLADGGPYQAGQPRLVGENGWELDVPNRSGTIYNQEQLAAMLGGGRGGAGGDTIIVNQSVSVGEFVTSSEYQKGLAGMRRAAGEGAVKAVKRERQRGGSMKSVFAGR